MKRKTLLSLAIVLSMIAAALPVVAVRALPISVELEFEDGSHEISYSPCEYFWVYVRVYNTPDITQYIVTLTWDPTNLELATGTEADVVKGDFLGGEVFLVTLGITPGRLEEVTEAKLSGTKAGSGLLFKVYFHCTAPSDDVIHFEQGILLNGMVNVPAALVDALVHQVPPPATPPQAVITEPITCTTIWVGTSVTLDGRNSVQGHDTMVVDEDCPITEYKWDIDVGNDGSIETTLYGDYLVDAFTCTDPGDVGITLTVTAPDPHPPSAPDYFPTDSAKVIIHQVVKPVGPAIDVITSRGPFPLGSTPNNNPIGVSDAFGPQEEICFYAKVTYNDEPVEYKPVGFQIINANGTTIDYRFAFTNASGIAEVCMRIPWEGMDAEDYFGTYSTWLQSMLQEQRSQTQSYGNMVG